MSRVPCAFSCDVEFLKLIDARAASLGMNRSQYVVQVLRQDLLTGRPNLNVVAESKPTYKIPRKRRPAAAAPSP